ncbi:MAG: hypothetical protein R2731_14390 [Nocardioides sp.]
MASMSGVNALYDDGDTYASAGAVTARIQAVGYRVVRNKMSLNPSVFATQVAQFNNLAAQGVRVMLRIVDWQPGWTEAQATARCGPT